MKLLKYATFLMLVIIILVMITATIVEKYIGYSQVIYGSWWFASLWALLAILSIIYIFRVRMQKRPVLLLLHLAFAVILCGACVTHFFGKQGMVHVRKYHPCTTLELDNNQYEKLPFTIFFSSFEVINYPGTDLPKDYVSDVCISKRSSVLLPIAEEEEALHISMNNIGEYEGYRFYQASYDPDLEGTILAVNYDPWGIGITYTGYALMFLSMILLLVLPNEGFRTVKRLFSTHQVKQNRIARVLYIVAIALAAGVFVFQLVMSMLRGYMGEYLPPVLNSPLLCIHVGIIILAYALLAIIFINSLLSLFQKDEEKVVQLQLMSRMLLFPALFFLSAGIFIGAIWANISWGRYWGWDPKEVWALITMLVYCFAMHQVSLPVFRKPKFFHLFMVFAFLSVLMTYFGVNFLLGGMHSYA